MKAGEKTLAVSMRITKPGEKPPTTSIRVNKHPAVPSRHEKPITGLKSSKNFITHNAVEAILQGSSLKISLVLLGWRRV